MAAVLRKAGRPLTYENGRGMLCSDTAAKVFARVLRKEMLPAVGPRIAGWQVRSSGCRGN